MAVTIPIPVQRGEKLKEGRKPSFGLLGGYFAFFVSSYLVVALLVLGMLLSTLVVAGARTGSSEGIGLILAIILPDWFSVVWRSFLPAILMGFLPFAFVGVVGSRLGLPLRLSAVAASIPTLWAGALGVALTVSEKHANISNLFDGRSWTYNIAMLAIPVGPVVAWMLFRNE